GFSAQNDFRAHFGLREATIIDSLQITWPSGIVQVLTDVAVNQFLTVNEDMSLYPPAVPTDLTATPGDQKVTLNWSANTEEDLVKYRIYSGTSSPASTLIDSVVGSVLVPPDTFYTDTELTNGQTYYYSITAVDTAGNESGNSAEVSAAPFEVFTRVTTGPVVAEYGTSHGGAWGDYDNDEDVDLFVATTGTNSNFLYANNGDGTFTKITTESVATDEINSFGGSWADYDNDGDLDLFVSNIGGTFNIYTNDGDGSFTRFLNGPSGGWPGLGYWGDYDNDGDLDLFVPNNDGSTSYLYSNNGDGTFEFLITGPVVTDEGNSQSAAWGDYDGDGDLDLFVANDGGNNFLYTNNGDGTFTSVTTGPIVTDGGYSLAGSWADYDNDGDLDLFVANTNYQQNFLYNNNGDGTFQKVDNSPVVTDEKHSQAGTWGDYDNDGDLDLFVSNGGHSGERNNLFTNNGDGSFTKVATGSVVSESNGTFGGSWGDYDDDGDLDLFVPVGDVTDILYQNNGNDNNWITIAAVGIVSNASGFRAKVRQKAVIGGNPVLQLRVISGQTGTSQDDFRGHFGLGDATIIDSLQIEWPSGIVQALTDVAVNTLLTVTEDMSLYPPAVPTGLTATADDQQVTLKWAANTEEDLVKYRIYSGTSSPALTLIDSVVGSVSVPPDTFYTDTDLTNGQTYYYRITAVDTAGNESGYSAEVSATPFALFTRVTTGPVVTVQDWSEGSAWGDYDNDGDLDLFVASTGTEGNYLYANNGDGTFAEVTTGPIITDQIGSAGGSWADYDNDGDIDLFIANLGGMNIYTNNGDGSFTRFLDGPSGCYLGYWGDYDNDGDVDLFVSNDQSSTSYLYNNHGDGTFELLSTGPVVTDEGDSRSAAWGDYDGDGDLDLFVANYGENNFLYANNGDGTFTKVTSGPIVTDGGNSRAGSWADYDNDGDLDLFVANTNYQPNFLYNNNGDGTFQKVDEGPVVTIGKNSQAGTWADYDNDGDLDLFVASGGGSGENNDLFTNNGDGSFTQVTIGFVVNDWSYCYGNSWADYDGDGDLDLLVHDNVHPDFLYNNNGNDNNWITIAAVGTVSNASAFGAKVRLRAVIGGNPVWQLRVISGQAGTGQSSLNAHFGLGDATVIDSLQVEWPSGIGQVLTNVAVDQFLTITEEVPPAIVTTNPATDITSTTATLHGTVNPYNLETKITFEYGTTTDYSDTVDATPGQIRGFGDQAVSVAITGLEPSSGYHFRVVAENTSGRVEGADETFTTLQATFAGVTTLPATMITTTSATLNGIVNPNGQSTTVVFEWGTTQSYEKPPVAVDQGALDGTQDVEVTADVPVEAGTDYYFRLAATTSAGTARSAGLGFTTPADETTTTGGQIIAGDGEVTIPGTNVTLGITFTTPGEDTIAVSQMDTQPGGSLPTDIDLLASRYWEIYHTGTGDIAAVDLTLITGPGTIVDPYLSTPSLIVLLRRDQEGQDWSEIASGTSATDSSVTFVGITGFSQFTVGEIPGSAPTSTTVAATGIIDTSAILHGTVNPGDLTTTVTFEWGLTTSYDGGAIDATPNQFTGTSDVQVSATLTGLTPDTEYHYRVVAENRLGRQDGADRTFTTLIIDVTAPEIGTPSIDATPPVNPGNDLKVTVVITDNIGVDQVHLHYALGGAANYKTPVSMQSSGTVADEYEVTIPGSDVGIRGIAYFVSARDAAENADSSEVQFVGVRFGNNVVTTSIPSSAFPSGFPKDQWRLLSIPADLDDRTVGSIIGNELGASKDTTWMLFRYTHNPSDQWREAASFNRGEAYWLYQRVDSDVEFNAGSGRTNQLINFDIELQPGWNLIGSPWPFGAAIQLDQLDFWGPITYNGSTWVTSIPDQLAPWGGYAVYNRDQANTYTVSLTGEPGGGISKELLAKANAEPPAGWLLHMEVRGATYRDGLNTIGRLEGASEGLDSFDNPEPPYIAEFISLAMERPDWGTKMPLMTSDIRSLEETGGVWDMAMHVKGESGPITLTSNLQGDLPPGHSAMLLDVLTREVHDLLAPGEPLTIRDYREDFPYHLKVIAGSADYVATTTEEILASLPEDFALAQNYPNPFNPNTTLRYSLYRPAKVALKVYSLLGQEVATLFNGWQDLGYYEVQWNSKDRFGRELPSGIYFARLSAPGVSRMIKMVLLR
ncbi:MAG: VCBS repeat-containing protein, partial [Fidelibacterota bacterium]